MARHDGYSRLDLAADVAKKTVGLNSEQARGVVDTVIQCMVDALMKGQDVCLQNFGTLEVRKLKGRKVNLPRPTAKGENYVVVPSRSTIRFKPSPALKGTVNEGP